MEKWEQIYIIKVLAMVCLDNKQKFLLHSHLRAMVCCHPRSCIEVHRSTRRCTVQYVCTVCTVAVGRCRTSDPNSTCCRAPLALPKLSIGRKVINVQMLGAHSNTTLRSRYSSSYAADESGRAAAGQRSLSGTEFLSFLVMLP